MVVITPALVRIFLVRGSVRGGALRTAQACWQRVVRRTMQFFLGMSGQTSRGVRGVRIPV